MPVLVAGSLSFGLLFLSLAKTAPITGSSTEFVTLDKCAGKADCQSIEFGTNGTKVEIIGAPVGSNPITDGKNFALGIFGKLIIEILALVVLWMAVMAALRSNKITESAVEPIAAFGKSLGDLMKNIPKYAPIIPVGGGKRMGVQGLANLGSGLNSSIQNASAGEGTRLGNTFGAAVAGGMGLAVDEQLAKVRQEIARMPNGGSKEQVGAQLENVLKAVAAKKSLSEFSAAPEYRKEFAGAVSKISDNVISKDKKEKIINHINKGNEKDMGTALKEIEEALGAQNFGGHNVEFGDVEKTKEWFKKYKENASGTPSTPAAAPITSTTLGTGPKTVNVNLTDNAVKFDRAAGAEPKVDITLPIADKKAKKADLAKAATESGMSEDALKSALAKLGVTIHD